MNNLILVLLAFASIFFAGGFFEYVSGGICLVLVCFFVCYLIGKNKIKLAIDINFLAIIVLVFSYLIVALWAVDSGVAVAGFFKFVPVLLFYVLLCNIEDKEKYILWLPDAGVLMVLLSFIMMQFNSMSHLVSVGGRMSGSFQYPNTFALFLLICVIVAVYSDEKDRLLQVVILLFGIYKSGSLTVYILTAAACVLLFIIKKDDRKLIGLGMVVAVLGVVIFIATGLLDLDMALKSSTFTGRLLYYKDALPVIVSHPFGLGYYGYFFVQPGIQTGVYSVLNVHNELLQLMLDVGVVPAVFFYGVIIRQLVIKEQSARNKLVILFVTLHTMLDYDFQFLAILFMVIMFMNTKKPRELKITKFTKVGLIIVFCLVGCGATVYGLSNWYFMKGDYSKACKVWNNNTRAQIQQLYVSDDMNECEEIARDIISRNEYIPVTYSVLADSCYVDGDVEGYIKHKTRAIELAPYDYLLYLDYLDGLYKACESYITIGELESAQICLDRMKYVKTILNKVQSKTSELAWKIQDKPVLVIPAEYEILINELEMKIYE